VYCAVVLDAFSRRVVGRSISNNRTAAPTSNALGRAIEQREAARGATAIHSDHRHITSWAFTERARQSGLVSSMGSVGDCYDNAMIEAFWSRMQVELLDTRRWKTRVEFANAIFEYIEIFHNRRRRHSRLGTPTPIEFELKNINTSTMGGRMSPETRLHQSRGTAQPPENSGSFKLVGEDGTVAPLPPLAVQAREQGVAAYDRIGEFRVARAHEHPPLAEAEKAPADG
jgi:hypothetical protein